MSDRPSNARRCSTCPIVRAIRAPGRCCARRSRCAGRGRGVPRRSGGWCRRSPPCRGNACFAGAANAQEPACVTATIPPKPRLRAVRLSCAATALRLRRHQCRTDPCLARGDDERPSPPRLAVAPSAAKGGQRRHARRLDRRGDGHRRQNGVWEDHTRALHRRRPSADLRQKLSTPARRRRHAQYLPSQPCGAGRAGAGYPNHVPESLRRTQSADDGVRHPCRAAACARRGR